MCDKEKDFWVLVMVAMLIILISFYSVFLEGLGGVFLIISEEFIPFEYVLGGSGQIW